jgi:methyltransferase (TIGR00027 family)
MRKNQSSLTAAGIAIVRAVESEKPADERICYDTYARRLVPAWLFHMTAFLIKTGYTEWRGPGVNGFLVARERYIDDVLQQYLQGGLQQLVTLGAGYDSRPYRFDLAGVKAYEVDHPATQAGKQAKVRSILGRSPEHVTYVAVDLTTQTLEERLLAAGYNPALKTLFIWQGVTMYLTAEAVDATLAFVVGRSRPGSAVVFDYIYSNILQGARQPNEVVNMRRYRFMTGEGLTFGIPEGTVEAFLTDRGFREVQDIQVDGLKKAYFRGKNTGRRVAGGYGIVIGKV